MYSAIIIEDEARAASLLANMLGQVIPAVTVLDQCGDLPSGVRSIRKFRPDIIFLDIELPVYSGIELLEFFGPDEIDFHIIFTTAFNEYAVKAFEMSAVDYLMKPLQEHQLQAAIAKLEHHKISIRKVQLPALQHNLKPAGGQKLVIPVHNGFEVINTPEILFLRAEGSYTTIAVRDGSSYVASKNLKHFQQLLASDEAFLRIHRSVVVNVRFIKKIVKETGYVALLSDQTELAIADDKVNVLLALLQKL